MRKPIRYYSHSGKPVVILTKPQRKALGSLFQRNAESCVNCKHKYREFRRTVQYDFLSDCAMIPVFGMWVGIETDGYTHS